MGTLATYKDVLEAQQSLAIIFIYRFLDLSNSKDALANLTLAIAKML